MIRNSEKIAGTLELLRGLLAGDEDSEGLLTGVEQASVEAERVASYLPELEEAALVDGAGPWKCLTSIFIPLAKPVIATIALFTIVQYWNEFFQGMVLSTNQSNYPLQTYIQQLVVNYDFSTMNVEQIAQVQKLNNQSLDAAKIVIAMIPVLAVYPFLQKYFVTGITLGSVKG